MSDMLVSLAMVTTGATCLTMAVAFFRLRRRHRALRQTLNRVVSERNALRWDNHVRMERHQ